MLSELFHKKVVPAMDKEAGFCLVAAKANDRSLLGDARYSLFSGRRYRDQLSSFQLQFIIVDCLQARAQELNSVP